MNSSNWLTMHIASATAGSFSITGTRWHFILVLAAPFTLLGTQLALRLDPTQTLSRALLTGAFGILCASSAFCFGGRVARTFILIGCVVAYLGSLMAFLGVSHSSPVRAGLLLTAYTAIYATVLALLHQRSRFRNFLVLEQAVALIGIQIQLVLHTWQVHSMSGDWPPQVGLNLLFWNPFALVIFLGIRSVFGPNRLITMFLWLPVAQSGVGMSWVGSWFEIPYMPLIGMVIEIIFIPVGVYFIVKPINLNRVGSQ